MSSLVKLSLMLLAASLVSACGFTPMYGEKTQAVLATGVKIEAPNNSMGEQFEQDLEDALNPTGMPPKPEYLLKVTLDSNTSAIGVARDGTVLRYNVVLISQYKLTRLSDGKIIQAND